ncbi:MAG: aspartate aminotransferase family protein [Endomicrobiales bacterium]|nr:aspartate aminotransferase family protein [Endomicrobiales bacterium]
MDDIISKEREYISQTYKRYRLVAKKAKGQYVWDDKGKKYLDFFAGLSVCNVGHAHPKIVTAIKNQSEKLIHISNLYYAESQVKLAEKLVKASFPGKVFFSNSGAEANECAIKLARKWAGGQRHEVISFENSFHGRTLATLAATAQEKFQKPFAPLPGGFKSARFNRLESVKRCINRKTAAVIIEPIQGEGGVVPADPWFLRNLRILCDRADILLIFDEVQSGMGRTGKLFAWQKYKVTPDIFTLAKSLAGGLPLGATIASKKVSGVFGFGDHGSTFGGNPVACAAAVQVLDLLNKDMLKNVEILGGYFMSGLFDLKAKYEFVKDVRGTGLMIGAELSVPAEGIVQYCLGKGLIVNCTQDKVLRFLPPFVITKSDADKAISILEEAFIHQRRISQKAII